MLLTVPAETLNCPMCGAPASTEASRCEHCGARLATVACPSCFGMMFIGEKFCSHCGAKAQRTEVSGAGSELCPRCRVGLKPVLIGNTNLLECPRCEGIWADADSLQQICNDREKQAAVLGMATPLAGTGATELEEKIRYLPCPCCKKLMNRVNFAHCSHVIVDVCTAHGTWFDRDELRRIVEFIRAGGLETARAQQIAELEERRRQLSAAQISRGPDASALSSGSNYGDWQLGISAAAEFLKLLLR
jgi:Zn-finger nucleic acid-binding protein